MEAADNERSSNMPDTYMITFQYDGPTRKPRKKSPTNNT